MFKKLIGVILLIAIGNLLFYYFGKKPQIHGTINLSILESPVQVVRDKWGVPHIKADSMKDLYAAYGFSVAQDRLFQMDLQRRMGNGQLSEIFGEKTLKWDKLFRSLGFRHTVEKLWKKQEKKVDPQMMILVESFLNGVNHYIDNFPAPIECDILQYRPKHFTIIDMLSFSGYMAYSFNESFRQDLILAKLAKSLPKNKSYDLLGLLAHPIDIKNSNENLLKDIDDIPNNMIEALHKFTLESSSWPKGMGLYGSNSWVLSGKRSQSGFPILANDPHIGFSNPGTWYEAHLKTNDWEIYGHFLSLIPFAVLGHNKHHGWAITMSEIDDMHFYRENIDWTQKKVRYKGNWIDVENRTETIKIKHNNDLSLNIMSTPHGPLVNSILPEKVGDSFPLAIKWAFYHPENLLMNTFYHMNMSKNLESFEKSLAYTKSPGLNVSYADKDGHIAWWVVGGIVKKKKHMVGKLIYDGASGNDELDEYFDFKDNPHLIDPPSGQIISANSIPPIDEKSVPASMLPFEGHWQANERYNHLNVLLSEKDKWNLNDLKSVQTQEMTFSTHEILPVLLSVIEKKSLELGPLEKLAYNELKDWNGRSDISSIGATIYHFLNQQIMQEILNEDLTKEDQRIFCSVAYMWRFYKHLLKKPSSPWWDNSFQDKIVQAFQATVRNLQEKYGSKINSWNWGKLHQVVYRHPIGKVWPFNYIFQVGPLHVGGGHTIINNMKQKNYCSSDFTVVAGPSTRRLIDFSNPHSSFGILPISNTGNITSPFYKDQVQLFLKGEYRSQEMKDEVWKDLKNGSHLWLRPLDKIL